MLVFFLIFLPLSFFRSLPDLPRLLLLLLFFTSERLLVSAIRGGRFVGNGAHGAVAAARADPAATLTAAAVGALHLRGGPAQAGADLVGHDLDHAALVAVLGLVTALLEPARHHGAGALAQRGGGVLAQLTPRDHVEERGLLLPLAVLLVAAVHGQA